jgi:TPR repeat protein
MTTKIGTVVNGALLWTALCSPALAAYVGPNPGVLAVQSDTDQEVLRRYDELVLSAAYHPNELYRFYAQKAAVNGRWGDAVRHFRIAARHADKYSQHRLSLLHWYGVGVPEDRVEAYLWSDLAAERGYPQLLAIREKMWRELTPAQQQKAIPAVIRGRPISCGRGAKTVLKRRRARHSFRWPSSGARPTSSTGVRKAWWSAGRITARRWRT